MHVPGRLAGAVTVVLSFCALRALAADGPFLALRDIKPGMHGVGKTVFSGDRIEDFEVEILGVLENIGPKQSLIMGRLSGGPLERTGVMQGMSGSPVYVGGKLIGAVALGFPFSKDPIAGIRPIEEMVAVSASPSDGLRAWRAPSEDLMAALPSRQNMTGGMAEIATPISFGGFTQSTLEQFGPRLRALGLEPRQGVGVGGRVENRMGDPAALHPGSMISVELMTGDLAVGADGTVTYIAGARVYAFGHRFLGVGPTGLPFTRSEVIALLPNLNSSFKISAPKELMGVISQDRNTAVAGELGRSAALVPVSIAMNRGGRNIETYRVRMVNDSYLSPILLQMAVFSAIDGRERAAGEASLTVSGQIELENGPAVPIRNVYSGQGALALQASLAAAIPLAYIQQAGFNGLRVKAVDLAIDATDKRRELQIEDVTLSQREAHPGDSVELVTRMTGEGGVQLSRSVRYQVPLGAGPGTLFFSVADGPQTSLAELRSLYGANARTREQLIAAVNRLRPNDKAYVRVWRSDSDFLISGEDLPDPPPSISMILAANAANQQVKNSKVAELVLDADGMMVTGAKTVQLEVRN